MLKCLGFLRGLISKSALIPSSIVDGAVLYRASHGKIFRDGRTTDVSILLTFDFPPESQGKACRSDSILLPTPLLSSPAQPNSTSSPPKPLYRNVERAVVRHRNHHRGWRMAVRER
jgi:hypothetical protein